MIDVNRQAEFQQAVLDNQNLQGAEQLMDDDQAKIEALVVFESVLAHQLPCWKALYQLVEIGMAALTQEQQNLRNAMLALTQVDFALPNAMENDDD